MSISDEAKAILVLTTRLGDRRRPSLPPRRFHKTWQALKDADAGLSDIFDPEFLEDPPAGVDGPAIAELVRDSAAVAVDLESLESKGIWTLTLVDDRYPEGLRGLGDAAPPCLFGAGDDTLLNSGGIGVVGSRNVDPDGAAVAQSLAETAARLGLPVVSGGARGVDQLAMNAAYQRGGEVIGALADSLESRIRKQDVRNALLAGSTCLITQQHPGAGFTPAAAMARNKVIYGLADITIVVASDHESGGTWAGATEALRRTYGRVAVWRGDGEGPGNAPLQQLGATPIHSATDLEPLLRDDPAEPPEQLQMY